MPHTNRQKRISASRVAQTNLIRRFHAIEKELAQLGHSAGADEKRQRHLSERDGLGGLSAYQNASVHGGDTQRGGESSKWLVRQLLDLPNDLIEWRGKPGSERRSTYVRMLPTKIRLLDVGAIAGTAYLKWSVYHFPSTRAWALTLMQKAVDRLDEHRPERPTPSRHQVRLLLLSQAGG